MIEVIMAYSIWLEMGLGILGLCAVYEFFFYDGV